MDLNLPLYMSTKAVAPTSANGYDAIHSITMALPPLIIEDCSLSYGRRHLNVTFNLLTWNDLDGLKLPPHFEYGIGMDIHFRKLAAGHVLGLARLGHTVSKKFKDLARRYHS